MRVLVAPQEFKGTLTAREAAEAIAGGVRRGFPEAEIDACPMSDGGPGMVEAALSADGTRMVSRVQDALGRPVEAAWALLKDGTAVIEMAAAAGLVLLSEARRDPRSTSTYGVGQLIVAALDGGASSIVVGLGGSATNDGGAGMAAALGARLLDADGRDVPPGGVALARLEHIDLSRLDARLAQYRVVAATDVMNPLVGPEGASEVYGPQKGATAKMVRELDWALRQYGEVVERDLGVRVLDVPGAGAAGGLGAGLVAFLGAEVRPGFDVLAELIGFEKRLRQADLVITGEGRLDGQTAYGKTVWRVAEATRALGVPVLVIAGSLGTGWERILPLVFGVEPVVGGTATEEMALDRPAEMLAATAQRALAGWRRMDEISREI